MSRTANQIKGIVDALKTQFALISGSTPYNNTISSSSIYTKYLLPNEIINFPAICIVGASGNYDQADQITTNNTFSVSGIAYSKNSVDPLDAGLKLLSDIENAIMSDATLGDTAAEISFTAEVFTIAQMDICLITWEINGLAEREEV